MLANAIRLVSAREDSLRAVCEPTLLFSVVERGKGTISFSIRVWIYDETVHTSKAVLKHALETPRE